MRKSNNYYYIKCSSNYVYTHNDGKEHRDLKKFFFYNWVAVLDFVEGRVGKTIAKTNIDGRHDESKLGHYA